MQRKAGRHMSICLPSCHATMPRSPPSSKNWHGSAQSLARTSLAISRQSNQEFRQHRVIRDIAIVKASRLHLRLDVLETLRVAGFDADEDRAKVPCRFLEILEPGDVIVRTKYRQEVFQRTGALRHTQDKILLEP